MNTYKQLLQYSILIGTLLSFVTCKKENGTGPTTDTVNWGYVKEFYTEKPIPGAMVIVYGVNPLWAVQDTLFTDSNGRYEFPLVDYLPELEVSAPGYLNSVIEVYAPGDFFDQQKRTTRLYQPAEIMLHVKNVKPFNGNIQVSLNDFIPVKRFNGNNIDTFICCLVARRYTKVDMQVVVRRNDQDSLFLIYHTPMKANGNIANIYYD